MADKTKKQSKRKKDLNGWVEIEDNPISKVGIFPYMGSEIGAPNPDQIYYVYRSEEELSDPDAIESFKLFPLVDDHCMLGEGETAAEDYGIEGVTGEKVYFDYPYLRANIKIFSSRGLKSVDDGKIELSPAYRCMYIFEEGYYKGEFYNVRQVMLRGNHLARVDEGRTGPDVKVLDAKMQITFDSAVLLNTNLEQSIMNEAQLLALRALLEAQGLTPEAIEEAIASAMATAGDENLTDEEKAAKDEADEKDKAKAGAATDEGDDETKAAEAAAEAATAAAEAEAASTEADAEATSAAEEAAAAAASAEGASEAESEAAEAAQLAVEALQEVSPEAAAAMDKAFKSMAAVNGGLRKSLAAVNARAKSTKGNGMDAGALVKAIAGRDGLATTLKPFVGTFDHSHMSLGEVADYGLKKLGLKAGTGIDSKVAVINAYAKGRTPQHKKPTHALDSAPVAGSAMQKYLNGGK